MFFSKCVRRRTNMYHMAEGDFAIEYIYSFILYNLLYGLTIQTKRNVLFTIKALIDLVVSITYRLMSHWLMTSCFSCNILQ